MRLADAAEEDDAVPHSIVADLHSPEPRIFWADLIASAFVGWSTFAIAVAAAPLSFLMWIAATFAVLALYRGVCFTHELAHLRRSAIPGFETAWNLLFGIPLLLPSFTYIGVHQSHHSLSSYGTKLDPEYLPFASSRRLLILFGVQSTIFMPVALIIRFLLLAPVALLWSPLHRWLEVHASSFSMNPEYRRAVSLETAAKMRRWELAMFAFWMTAVYACYAGALPLRAFSIWLGVLTLISLLNTVRVLGAHEYDSAGAILSRHGQLADSIDTPGAPWTELWAPVGLRYHALHHYFPGIPYHNLGAAYRRISTTVQENTSYLESTSPSLRQSLVALYNKARAARG